MGFTNRIYQLLQQVPKGRVTTYKALAEVLGTKAYQAVGTAMRNNPYAPQVPCHRVVTSSGQIGGFQGHKTGPSIQNKIGLLQKEGVQVKNNRVVNFDQILFTDFHLPSAR